MGPANDKHQAPTNGCSKQDSQTLQKIQNEATRLVTGLTRSVSLENLFKECGWTTLSKRRQQHKRSFMYKVNNGIVPSYIQDLIPPLVGEFSNYPLRNNRNISVPFNRTSISQKSCIPSFFRLWNSLEDDLKNLSTLQTFKNILLQDSITHVFLLTLQKEIDIFPYCMHDFEIFAATLIMTFFINHLRDNPLCDLCGMIENAIHYFFHCRKFTIERQVFNDTVRVFQP